MLGITEYRQGRPLVDVSFLIWYLCCEVYLYSVYARIERGQGADLGKWHFCAQPIILRALLRVILHFFIKGVDLPKGKKKKIGYDGRQECSTEYDRSKPCEKVGEHFSVVASERQPRCVGRS